MRKYLILFLAFTNFVFGQDFDLVTTNPTITKPEPSIASLMRFEEIPVSNYTGIPNINVPCFSLPTRSKDISLDFSLAYHPSSVGISEEAGQCGIGWSLFSGGAISRTATQKPDELFFVNGTPANDPKDIYQYNFMGNFGRFYVQKNSQGALEVRILENTNSKIVINLNYNSTTYVVNSFTIYDDKGYSYLFEDKDRQYYFVGSNPNTLYNSAYHLSKVFDNNGKELLQYSYNTYSYTIPNYALSINSYKKISQITSHGYGTVNFVYSTGTNYTYTPEIRINEFKLVNYQNTTVKKVKLYFLDKNLSKVEKTGSNEIEKEIYEFNYKLINITEPGTFEKDMWGYRVFQPSCLFSYPIENIDYNIGAKYADYGVLTHMKLPTGGSVNFKYEPNTYSIHKRVNGVWQVEDDPEAYYYDTNPENFIISTLAYKEFTGNGTNTYTFTVPGTGTTPQEYFINVTKTPYTSATIDNTTYAGFYDPNQPFFYPNLYISGSGFNGQYELFEYNSSLNLCLGEPLWLMPGQTYTITINTPYGDINKKGKIHVSKKSKKPNPSKLLYGGGVRIKEIAYFDKLTINYYDDELNNQNIMPSKRKSYSYNFFNQPDVSSGAINYPGHDVDINNRIYREPIGYKNVTVSETGLGRQQFTYTTPMDFPYNSNDAGLNVIYYDYKRGLLTNHQVFNQANQLLSNTEMTYDFVETPNATFLVENPLLNERFGWTKLTQRKVQSYYENSATPMEVVENFIYHDPIRKIASRELIVDPTETLKTTYTYHVGNSTLSQNRISEIERIEATKNGVLLSTSKVSYSETWNGNVSFLPETISVGKATQPLTTKTRFISYDEYSNPTELKQEGGNTITYLWGYNKTSPIARIENATNAQVAIALGVINVNQLTEAHMTSIDNLRTNPAFTNSSITTYSYIPLVGISSLKDAKGDVINYVYDDFGRLKFMKDKDNNILSENEYHYADGINDLSYVKSMTYKVESSTSLSNPTITQAITNKTFLDGLGRPIQQIAHQQSNSGKDVVIHIEYDNYGRNAIDYLPYVNTTASLNYNINAKNEILAYPEYAGETPFSEKRFENSPFSRVIEQSAPGSIWSMSNQDSHTIKMSYLTNTTADQVKKYTANADESTFGMANYFGINIVDNGFYSENSLTKSVMKNENWEPADGLKNTTEEYKDKTGKVILKRIYAESVVNNVMTFTAHDTYNIYDQYNNLTYVIPPLVNTSQTITQDILDNLCYQYRYDNKNRIVEKKSPAKQWEFVVYDKLDRIVANGPTLSPFNDANLIGTYGWSITKYDALGRSVLTAWMVGDTSSLGRKTLQNNYETTSAPLFENKTSTNTTVNNVGFKYSNLSYPNGTNYHVLSVNYFDDYNFFGAPTTFGNVMHDGSQVVYYNNTIKPKGLPTGSWVRVVEAITTSPVKADITYNLYDKKARIVRTKTINYLTGYTQIDSKLEPFTGKLLYSETKHKRSNTNNEIYVREDYTYSNQERLLTHTHKIGLTGTVQTLTSNTYTELGRLKNKVVGSAPTTNAPLQRVDYSYNIRGWITEINKVSALAQSGDPVDLFAFKINYDQVENDTGLNSKALYNGNISEVYWKSNSDNVKRKYSYEYDSMNRLKNAIYQKPDTATPITNSYNEAATYDKNGNIITLFRNGDLDSETFFITIDDLDYTYHPDKPNQLMKVEDASNHPEGFKDSTTNTTNDYTYDDNGNLTSDLNKNISSIKYNHFNLPLEINFTGTPTKKITYLYNAVGQKLRKVVTIGTTVTTTDYLSGFHYTQATAAGNIVLSFFPHAEGYVNNTVVSGNNVYDYVYNYTDHLGNVRMNYTWNSATGSVKILEENHYYPYGLKHTKYNIQSYNFVPTSSGGYNTGLTIRNSNQRNMYQYKLNGKEYQDELGLNMYAMDMRQYDPAIARWVIQDPIIHFNMSPYNAFDNNPVFWADPSGGNSVNPITVAIILACLFVTPEGGQGYFTMENNSEGASSGGGEKNDEAPKGPNSEFDSPDEAAIDFAKLYNGASIINNVELKSLIYKKANGKFSYTVPYGLIQYNGSGERRGGSAGNIPDELKPPKGSVTVASIHTHAADMSGRGDPPNSENEFSQPDLYSAMGWDGELQKFVKEKRQTMYVVTPNGQLLVFDVSSSDLTRKARNNIGGKSIPCDPMSPSHINDISPNVCPNIDPVVIDTDGSKAFLYFKFNSKREFHKNPDKEKF